MLDDSAVVSAVQSQEWQRERDQELEVANRVVNSGVDFAAKSGVRAPESPTSMSSGLTASARIAGVRRGFRRECDFRRTAVG